MTLGMIHRRAIGPFAVDVWEGGTGSPLLFLHGYERHPGDAAFLRRLAQHHHVWAPEQPGYGTSVGGEQIHDILDLVLFYRALIRDLDAGPVDLVGHSIGGMLAAEIASIAPDVVRRLVLVDAFGLWLDEEPAMDPFGARDAVLKAKWHDPANRPNPEPTNFVPESGRSSGRLPLPGAQLRGGHPDHVADRRAGAAAPDPLRHCADPRRARQLTTACSRSATPRRWSG